MSVVLSGPARDGADKLTHVTRQLKLGREPQLKLQQARLLELGQRYRDALAIPEACLPPQPTADCSSEILRGWGDDALTAALALQPLLADELQQLDLQGSGDGSGSLLNGITASKQAVCRWNEQALWYASRVPMAERPHCWAASRTLGYTDGSSACGRLARDVAVGDMHFDLALISQVGDEPDFGVADRCNGFADLHGQLLLAGREEITIGCRGLPEPATEALVEERQGDATPLPRLGPEWRLEKLKQSDLREHCRARGLTLGGRKGEQIERLLKWEEENLDPPDEEDPMPIGGPGGGEEGAAEAEECTTIEILTEQPVGAGGGAVVHFDPTSPRGESVPGSTCGGGSHL